MVELWRWLSYGGGPVVEVVEFIEVVGLYRWSCHRGDGVMEVVGLYRWSCHRGDGVIEVVGLWR